MRFVLDHVALGVPSVAEAAAVLAGELGGKPFAGGPGVGYRGGQWEFAAGERLELIEPAGPPGGFLERFLARHGPGVHHVTFKVPSIHAACERVRSLGYEVVGFNDSNPGWKEAFLHPKQALGIVVQLAESDPALDAEWSASWDAPPVPPSAPPPVRVRALHLAAPSLEVARRQWEQALGGQLERDGERLHLRWPDSPLSLVVHVCPDAAPGPLHLELAGRAPGRSLEEAARRLGVPLIDTSGDPGPT